MARPKSQFRNELKTRVTDRAYTGVRAYMRATRCDSESRAVSELLEIALFGIVGSVPDLMPDSSHETAINGPTTEKQNVLKISQLVVAGH